MFVAKTSTGSHCQKKKQLVVASFWYLFLFLCVANQQVILIEAQQYIFLDKNAFGGI